MQSKNRPKNQLVVTTLNSKWRACLLRWSDSRGHSAATIDVRTSWSALRPARSFKKYSGGKINLTTETRNLRWMVVNLCFETRWLSTKKHLLLGGIVKHLLLESWSLDSNRCQVHGVRMRLELVLNSPWFGYHLNRSFYSEALFLEHPSLFV